MELERLDRQATQSSTAGGRSGATRQVTPMTWHSLAVFNFYRLALASLFLGLAVSGRMPSPLGQEHPLLFLVVSGAYFLAALLSALMVRQYQLPFRVQVSGQMSADIVALSLLTYASGGIGSGVEMLLLVSIAGGGLLLEGRYALLFAALGAIAALADPLYKTLYVMDGQALFTQAGLLGGALFATAGVAHAFGRRMRSTEQLAAQRGVDLANQEHLNQQIVERLQGGVVVVDPDNEIQLLNVAAWHLCGLTGDIQGQPLAALDASLDQQLHEWRQNPGSQPPPFRLSGSSAPIQARFTPLDEHEGWVLIFLEDTSVLARQAHQRRLAALGQLTASIAHEIRNPLGAISHAGQMLREVGTLGQQEARLTSIIESQVSRMNAVVESVLQASRGGAGRVMDVQLRSRLQQLGEEAEQFEGVAPGKVLIKVSSPDLMVRFDPDHLHQVLSNLITNALRYSPDRPGKPRVELRAGFAESGHDVVLDVVDFGPGIPPSQAEQIFDPFYTTDSQGTGLGLYIARELCEANAAELQYIPLPLGGSCFRVRFQRGGVEPQDEGKTPVAEGAGPKGT